MRYFEANLPKNGSVRVESLGLALCGVSIAGPKSRALLEKVVSANVSAKAFRFMDIRAMEIGHAPALVGRVTYTGDLGFEPMPLDAAAILSTAIRQRAEARSARLDIASAKLDQRLAKNLLLPSLGLVGRYELVGLGGLGNPDFQPPPTASDRDEGNAFSDAYDVLDSTDFFRYRIGVELEVPLSNAEARSRDAQADIARRRADERLRAIVSDIALEIQQALGDVGSAEKRVVAARLARELAEQNLADQKKRYDVGIVTTTDILDFQDKATNAMAAEARAVADHAVAVAELERAQGSLLPSYGIRVEFANAPGKEWWSRF